MEKDIIRQVIDDLTGEWVSIDAGDLLLLTLGYEAVMEDEAGWSTEKRTEFVAALGNIIATIVQTPANARKAIEESRRAYLRACMVQDAVQKLAAKKDKSALYLLNALLEGAADVEDTLEPIIDDKERK